MRELAYDGSIKIDTKTTPFKYTITTPPGWWDGDLDDYKEFLSRARAQGISFAKFMENAAKNYIASLDNND